MYIQKIENDRKTNIQYQIKICNWTFFLFLGFTMDPREKQPYGPKIYIESYESKSELDYFIHFLPVRFIKETLLPATNTYEKKNNMQIIC